MVQRPPLRIGLVPLLVALPLWAAANPIRISPGPLSQRHVAQPAFGQRAHRQLIVNQPSDGVQFAFLMTDGSVLAQGGAGNDWYKYVPDINGNYADGTWTQVATMPKGYAPSAFSSAVLADGRLAVSGGEYNTPGNYQLQLTNLGAIYDPVKNTWTKLGHPRGWGFIGDSPNSVLPNGNFLVGQKLTEQAAYLSPATLKWTKVPTKGKSDFNSEEGWTLLPNGTVLTIGYDMAIYTPVGSPQASWAPTISSVPTTLTRGSTYQVTGTQFNGLSQAEAFGDEFQNATNYPLVRIVNNKTKHVFYARTHGHSTMAVATGSTPVSTNFDVPAAAEAGASTLVVVANGIPSAPAAVTLK